MNNRRRTEWYSVRLLRHGRTEYHSVLRQVFIDRANSGTRTDAVDPVMHAEVIAIGDEITSGQTLDTNSAWLSRRLEELGLRTLYHTTVGDDFDALAAVFHAAVQRADVVVATGGIGPTDDDITRQCVAQVAGRELVLDADSLEHIRAMFAKFGRPMPERNRRQAMFPQGAQAIPNPHGTAPGIAIDLPRKEAGPCSLFVLPGVPAEMRTMWEDTVRGAIRRLGGGRTIVRHRKIRLFGAGESQVEAMLPDLIRRGRQPRVGITASQTVITLRITAQGATEEECEAAMRPTVRIIRECLGERIFGEGDDELEHAVVRQLRRRNKTLATAEWATGESGTAGLIAQRLGAVDAGRASYLAGLVVADDATAIRLLDIPPDLLDQHTSCSAQVTAATAQSLRRRFAVDLSLAVSPFPPSDPDAAQPACSYVAVADADGVQVKSYPFTVQPPLRKVFTANRALNQLRLALRRSDGARGC